jgi:sterol desaturase/sphingolipid hydroxylase (fatty acid hydroxylase superfamily)
MFCAWAFREEGTRVLHAAGVPIDFATFMLLLSVALLLCAQLLWPADPRWGYRLSGDSTRGFVGFNDAMRDLFYLVLVAPLSALLIQVVSTRLGPALPTVALWPHAAPFAARATLAFLVVEFFSYWAHWAAHQVPLLWRFHATHHVVTRLGALKALRTHPVDNLLFSVARSLPLLLVGVGTEELVAALSFGGTLSFLAHANLDVAAGPLGLVVNYPSYHAVHHSADVAEASSNYGCHTILWDRLFGTFRPHAGQPLEIGVRPLGPRSLWAELVAPFYRAP